VTYSHTDFSFACDYVTKLGVPFAPPHKKATPDGVGEDGDGSMDNDNDTSGVCFVSPVCATPW
jgi:hypothetical protein